MAHGTATDTDQELGKWLTEQVAHATPDGHPPSLLVVVPRNPQAKLAAATIRAVLWPRVLGMTDGGRYTTLEGGATIRIITWLSDPEHLAGLRVDNVFWTPGNGVNPPEHLDRMVELRVRATAAYWGAPNRPSPAGQAGRQSTGGK